MEIKILQVFYGKDGLPYKDQQRTIHFPIVGNGFQGASNTTKIRFYYGELGDSATSWVATSKLPNGKIGSKVLSTYLDSDLDESYALLELSSFYFQYKGDVFISLQGYEGGVQVEYDSVHEIYKIVGTPTIQTTGSIKLSVNYATQFVGSGEIENVDMQYLLALVGEKANDDDVVHKAGAETITGSKTFTGNNEFDGITEFNGVVNYTNNAVFNGYSANGQISLFYSRITTNNKGYFSRVGVTNNQYIYYDLPKSYADVGNQVHYTLATEEYVEDVLVDLSSLTPTHAGISGTITDQATIQKLLKNGCVVKAVNGNILHFSIDTTYNGLYRKSFRTVRPSGNSVNWTLLWEDYLLTFTFNEDYSSADYTFYKHDNFSPYSDTFGITWYTSTQVDNLISSAISTVYKIQAPKTVAELNALTLSSSMIGYVYNVTTSGTLTAGSVTVVAGDNVVVVENGGSYIFDKLAGTIDLSGYVQTSRTIAGIALSSDITAQALTDALVLASNTDIDNLF